MRGERTRRVFDVVAALGGLVCLSPFFLLIAVAIVLDDRGPVFFRQVRVGKDGRDFRMWKFRTMIVDAERRGPMLTVGADPRITRVGAVLRRTKFDELPQIINVLLGQMTFVGPRPEVRRYVDQYTSEQREVLALKPGITDPASLAYYDESEQLALAPDPEAIYVGQIMPDKIRLNLAYARQASLISDLKVIGQTVLRPVRGRKILSSGAPGSV